MLVLFTFLGILFCALCYDIWMGGDLSGQSGAELES